MASPKKRVNPLFVALAVVLVAVVAAVGVVFFQLHSKISALQTGASFTFRYEIAPNSPDKPPLLNILERVNASSGSVSPESCSFPSTSSTKTTPSRRLPSPGSISTRKRRFSTSGSSTLFCVRMSPINSPSQAFFCPSGASETTSPRRRLPPCWASRRTRSSCRSFPASPSRSRG
mgnify:CR=1 FL=1